MIISGQNKF